MSGLFTTAPNGFVWATGIEDTFIPQARPGLRALDEYELTQHYAQWRSDIDLVAETGARAVRWGVPWHKVQPEPSSWDWAWTDAVLDYMVNGRRIVPILDLMHYGTPTWLEGSFADPSYPERVADYARAVAARYKGLVRHYTPLNEPHINALMCGQSGLWPPYLSGPAGYLRVLLALARGIVLTVQALRAEQPDMHTVQVEALWHDWSRDPALGSACQFGNARQFLSLDLTTGQVGGDHELLGWLREHGVTDAELSWFAENRVSFDILGANYCPWAYTEKVRRPDGSIRSVKRTTTHGSTIDTVLSEAHRRYGLPIVVTETSAKGSVARRGRWMDQTLAAVRDLRAAGVPVVGYTWFPLFTMLDWDYRTGEKPLSDYRLHLGLFDTALDDQGALVRHATPLVARYRRHMRQPMPVLGTAPAPAPSATQGLASGLNPALAERH